MKPGQARCHKGHVWDWKDSQICPHCTYENMSELRGADLCGTCVFDIPIEIEPTYCEDCKWFNPGNLFSFWDKCEHPNNKRNNTKYMRKVWYNEHPFEKNSGTVCFDFEEK